MQLDKITFVIPVWKPNFASRVVARALDSLDLLASIERRRRLIACEDDRLPGALIEINNISIKTPHVLPD